MIIAIRRERECYSSALIHQHTVKTKSLKLLNPDNVIHVPQIVKIVCVCVCVCVPALIHNLLLLGEAPQYETAMFFLSVCLSVHVRHPYCT